MDFGHIHSVIVTTKDGNVVYERYYDRLSEMDKSELRATLYQAICSSNLTQDEQEQVGCFRGANFVFMGFNDLVFFCIGSGEYDELALTHVLRVILVALRNVVSKNISEASLFESYGQLCLVIDEVINEGVLESVDKDHIRKGTKNKGYWE